MNLSLFPTLRRRTAPFSELTPFESWFRDFFEEQPRLPSLQETRVPRADIAETDKEFLVTLELPGMDEKEIDVRLSGNQLIVSGERKQRKEEKEKHYHRIETTYGAFERRFDLPLEVRKDPETIKATFQKGMLEIRIPKAEPRPMARIQVKAT